MAGLVTTQQFPGLVADVPGALSRGLALGGQFQQLQQQGQQAAIESQIQSLRGQALGGDARAAQQLGTISPKSLEETLSLQKQQSSLSEESKRSAMENAVKIASQAKSTPTTEGKIQILQQESQRLRGINSNTSIVDDAIRLLQEGNTELADDILSGVIEHGERFGIIQPTAAGPSPQIKQGLGPKGQPGFFAVTPEGATPIPGITPAPRGPLVTIAGDEAVSEEKKAIAKIQAQNFKEVIDAGRNAESTLQTLDQLDAIDIETGALEPFKAGLAAVVEGFGVDASALADVTTAQSLDAVSNRMVNDVLNAAKGPQTEGDAQRAKKTIRQLGDDPLAGQFKSDSLRALALRKVEQSDFVADQISDGKTFTQADKAWREFKKKTPSLSAVVKNPQTGLPIFFYQFKQNAKRMREGISDQEIIKAWRQVHAK